MLAASLLSRNSPTGTLWEPAAVLSLLSSVSPIQALGKPCFVVLRQQETIVSAYRDGSLGTMETREIGRASQSAPNHFRPLVPLVSVTGSEVGAINMPTKIMIANSRCANPCPGLTRLVSSRALLSSRPKRAAGTVSRNIFVLFLHARFHAARFSTGASGKTKRRKKRAPT